TSIVPISTLINKLQAEDVIDEISIKAFDEQQPYILKPILEDITLNLRRGQPIFVIESAIEEAEKSKENSRMFQIVFFFISLISLLVGGIVIMNIMLATIQERTREIGIRLAVGARQIDILIQFLVQTVVITFIGGVFGVGSAILILDKVGEFLKISTKLDISMIFIALAVSVLVGLFFGIYPAVKASKLDPVQALRYE
ncbi:MAG: FtsX-like permease family protein, partial [Candidatus Cloacimonetes bacterium]|nr:FtsX-like permease family protein [Candidatus Cloacimonadota bacterium]